MNTKIKCPVCGKETGWQENAFRPFCSERCSLIDLGKWADGKYSVEVEQESKEEQGEKDDE
ncbi:MAG: DNA gyrase inhibitor YacG [Deltaproteobacteria bacterium]|nr:DNA gyrase inhibitor YacG [Deltaproteobacteria bacterium]